MRLRTHHPSYFLICLSLIAMRSVVSLAATSPTATWVSGSDIRDNLGVHRAKGVADPDSTPGARRGSVSWVDKAGYLWLFGGQGPDSTGHTGESNELWKYDGRYWTWVSGSSSVDSIGVYGVKGVPSSANVPGARRGAFSWIDAQGNLWLFGGSGYDREGLRGNLNDLWRFDGVNWTWISGSNSINVYRGVYGVKGVPDPANIPGTRSYGVTWIDSKGNLWLFGGTGSDRLGSQGSLNDLWKFDGANWTWVSGSDTVDSSGVYGTQGVADPANVPGARDEGVSWTDGAGNLWLFGGSGKAAPGHGGFLNDLWKFDGVNWTWVSGSNSSNRPGVYGIQNVADSANVPGGRYGSISWTDAQNNLWLFGGHGYDSAGAYFARLNDLWKYDGSAWTWVRGSSTASAAGVYGDKGVADPANMPGARDEGVSWTDGAGNLWLFGGEGHDSEGYLGLLNDLWKFDLTSSGSGAIYYVNDDATGANDGSSWQDAFNNLQDALDIVVSGDQIWVAAGTYKPTSRYGTIGGDRDKHFRMKNGVAIYGGFNGTESPLMDLRNRDIRANETILSGDIGVPGDPSDNCYHVFYHWNVDLDSSAVLDGFTITAGNAEGVADSWSTYAGGGMYNKDDSPTISNCTFTGNSAVRGAGIYNDTSGPLVNLCVFYDNTASEGGAIGNDLYSDPTITNSVFTGNEASYWGGGMYNDEGSTPIILHCTFSDNTAPNGGGMYNRYHSEVTVTNCAFWDNIAVEDGGGIRNINNISVITDCTFRGNSAGKGGGIANGGISSSIVDNCAFTRNAADSGGAMCCDEKNDTAVTNCIFTGNTSSYGGGIFNDESDSRVTCCSFSGNIASTYGGAIYSINNSTPIITNCILRGDTAPEGGDELYNESSVPVIAYSDISGCLDGDGWDASLGSDGGGNIDEDAMFIRMPYDGGDGWGDDPSTDGIDEGANDDLGDLRLQITSPCIDAGDNDAVPAGVTTDLDGMPRFVDQQAVEDAGNGAAPVVDMGAYERQPGAVIYVDQDVTGGDGSSWSKAFNQLQEALDIAQAGDRIWVAAGTYVPTYDYKLGVGIRGRHFRMKNWVAIYGGFEGSETSLDQRDIRANQTILSGDIGVPGDPSDNCYHVFYHWDIGLDASAVLDGFTITGGNADGNNGASGQRFGGGMENMQCSPTIVHCTFRGNIAVNYGGGMFNWVRSSPSVTDCVFVANTANTGGGMCNNSSSSPIVTNCTFSRNIASLYGGALFNLNTSFPVITNCILQADDASGLGDEIFNDTSTPLIAYSDVEGCLSGGTWDTSLGGDGGGNIDADPLFVRMPDDGGDGWGDDPLTPDVDEGADDDYGDLRLKSGSGCIDAGDNDARPVDVTTDLDSMPRFTDDPAIADTGRGSAPLVDMGAYERQMPRIIYVNQAASAGDGGTWANAFAQLQNALDVAKPGDQIWVAAGTYMPTSDYGLGIGERGRHFRMRNGVAIYGGFDGVEVTLEQRSVLTNRTILSGDIGVPGDPSDNCYHVFYHPDGASLDETAVLDGFTITAGNANDPNHNSGGGMYNSTSSPTLIECTFRNNAAYLGGGMYNEQYSRTTVLRCTFRGNTATSGGGMFNQDHSSPTVAGCLFMGNRTNLGGGMDNYDQCYPAVSDCVFCGNNSFLGAGMYNNRSYPALSNCTFCNNTANLGGAMQNVDNSNPTVYNCILRDDYATTSGNEIYNDSSAPIIGHSNITGCLDGNAWDESLGANAGANIDQDPSFVRIPDDGGDGWGDDPATAGIDEGDNDDYGDLQLRSGSPCTDAGDNNRVTSTLDAAGVSRIIDGNCDTLATVDMGAYEYSHRYQGDLNYDCSVNLLDISVLLADWSTSATQADVSAGSGDATVDMADLLVIANHWLDSW